MSMNFMNLKSRAIEFSNIVSNSICTNFNQKVFSLEESIQEVMLNLKQLRVNKGVLYIVGNGGSAAVASHALVDFVNVAKLNAQVLHEPSLLTCMANDFDYENVYSRVLTQCLKPTDMLIAISSSGKSKNICNAASVAREKNASIITFTGFSASNELRSLGDFNYWLDSTDYGYVEVGHQFILHNLSDRFGVEKIVMQEKLQAELVD